MKVIAFVSGKGGVGKTTLAFLLGLVLQRAGRRVAFLDLDPQASLDSLLSLHNVQPQEETQAEFLIVDTPGSDIIFHPARMLCARSDGRMGSAG